MRTRELVIAIVDISRYFLGYYLSRGTPPSIVTAGFTFAIVMRGGIKVVIMLVNGEGYEIYTLIKLIY